MKEELLIKYLKNSCSEKEFEEFTALITENIQNEYLKDLSFEQWKNLDLELEIKDKERYNAQLDRIHHQINLKQTENQIKVGTMPTIAKWLSHIAAILFLPLLGVVFYLLSENIKSEKYTAMAVDTLEVTSPIGSRTVVQLTDGTEVTLNYGSKIYYPRSFKGNTREVKLTGEGFFKVAHNPEQPFIVKTEKLNIKAVGTTFNVHAYPDEDYVTTTLLEGKVLLEKAIDREKTEQIGAMKPSQHINYNFKTGKLISTAGSTEKYVAWKDGKMIFDNSPINEVTNELSRKYNVDIEVADEVKYLTYTVTFADDPLFLILDLMTETTPIVYKRFPRTKLADGSFSKQKIRIEKRK